MRLMAVWSPERSIQTERASRVAKAPVLQLTFCTAYQEAIVSDQGNVKDISHILEGIQRQIAEQERAIYTPTVIEHAHHPRNWGRMDRADACKIWQGPCGDMMEFYLRLDKDGTDRTVIREISFMTDGCGPSVACGSMLTSMVQRKTLEEVLEIEPRDLLIALGGLPQESVHCAFLAVHTVHDAIDSWSRSAHSQGEESDDG
jgi:nitrogen fixation NifU-like protein